MSILLVEKKGSLLEKDSIDTAREILDSIGVKLLWFDSLGAKSSCFRISTKSGDILVDPGAAIMQPSYPLTREEKYELRRRAVEYIKPFLEKSKIVVITHYHYDHYMLPRDRDIGDTPYQGKLLVVKNPNTFINLSQWKRSRVFLSMLLERENMSLRDITIEPSQLDCSDPVEELEVARESRRKYQNRDWEKLLSNGRKWFQRLCRTWSRSEWVREVDLPSNTRVVWGDSRELVLGDTTIRILEPWFHGGEYERTGWVTPLLVEKSSKKLFYSSDLMGPVVEDYAVYIVREKPDILILDGPPTYLFPYMVGRVDIERAISNLEFIIENNPQLIVYDHHLLREKKWREYISDILRIAERQGVVLATAAEILGRKPLIDTL